MRSESSDSVVGVGFVEDCVFLVVVLSLTGAAVDFWSFGVRFEPSSASSEVFDRIFLVALGLVAPKGLVRELPLLVVVLAAFGISTEGYAWTTQASSPEYPTNESNVHREQDWV